MLNQFPPGGAPADVNRQLPQNLSVPGLQQQVAGTPDPFGQVPGTLNQQSGINAMPPPGGGGMSAPPGMLGMPPPGGGVPGMPGAPSAFGGAGGANGGMPGGVGAPPAGMPPPNSMGGSMIPGAGPGGQPPNQDISSYVNALTKPSGV